LNCHASEQQDLIVSFLVRDKAGIRTEPILEARLLSNTTDSRQTTYRSPKHRQPGKSDISLDTGRDKWKGLQQDDHWVSP
jgi:hypothetical protein